MIPSRRCLEGMTPYQPGKSHPGSIKLASNENALGTSPKAIQAITQSLDTVNRYPDGGCTSLRTKLAAHLGLADSHFIFGNGSDELLLLAAGAFLERGENVVTSQVTFSEYAFAARVFDGEVRQCPSREGKYDLEAIREQTDNKTRIIFLANPNNPTGTYFSHRELAELLNHVSKETLVIVDEAYVEYVDAGDFPKSMDLQQAHSNLLILRTFSKAYGLAGLRIGYGIGHPEIIEAMNKVRPPFNVNQLAQTAAVAALDDKEFLQKAVSNNREGKAYLYEHLDRIGVRFLPTQANFILISLTEDGRSVFDKMQKLGVTIRPMGGFGLPQAIRVTIGTPKENQLFVQALQQIVDSGNES